MSLASSSGESRSNTRVEWCRAYKLDPVVEDFPLNKSRPYKMLLNVYEPPALQEAFNIDPSLKYLACTPLHKVNQGPAEYAKLALQGVLG